MSRLAPPEAIEWLGCDFSRIHQRGARSFTLDLDDANARGPDNGHGGYRDASHPNSIAGRTARLGRPVAGIRFIPQRVARVACVAGRATN